MTSSTLFRLASVSLAAGGMLGIAAHAMHPACPNDPGMLLSYAQRSQTTHLILFFGVILVLLGLPGVLIRQRTQAGLIGFASVHLLFFALLFGELLHSVLEFTILPLLIRSVPYATIPLAHATYQSTPLAILHKLGYTFYLLGCPLLGFVTLRARILPAWAAFPFCLTAVFNFAAFLLSLRGFANWIFPLSFYASICILAAGLWISVRPSFAFYNMPSNLHDVREDEEKRG